MVTCKIMRVTWPMFRTMAHPLLAISKSHRAELARINLQEVWKAEDQEGRNQLQVPITTGPREQALVQGPLYPAGMLNKLYSGRRVKNNTSLVCCRYVFKLSVFLKDMCEYASLWIWPKFIDLPLLFDIDLVIKDSELIIVARNRFYSCNKPSEVSLNWRVTLMKATAQYNQITCRLLMFPGLCYKETRPWSISCKILFNRLWFSGSCKLHQSRGWWTSGKLSHEWQWGGRIESSAMCTPWSAPSVLPCACDIIQPQKWLG